MRPGRTKTAAWVTVTGVLALIVLGVWWLWQDGEPQHHQAGRQSSEQAASAPEDAQRTEEERQSGPSHQRNPEGQAYAMVSPYKQQLIGVTTAVVEKRPLETTVRAVGRVDYSEERITHVNLRITGWVDELFVDYTGQLVRKGQPLFTLYSPDLVATQDEFLLALRTREQVRGSPLPQAREQAERLVEAARDRLRLWTLTDEQIDEIARRRKAKTYLTIASPATGYVIDKKVFKGMFVEPEIRLYSIADLSVVWMHAEVYEYEVPFVEVGQAVTAQFSAYPGEAFLGRVSYIYPYLSQKARTVRLRVEMPNPQLRLKPEMYGTARITVDRGARLAVPESAVLNSGTRAIVFVVRGEGLFEPREVRLGPKIGTYYEVGEGLSEGDRVVTSGNFLIDSESKLMASSNMMGSLGMGGVKMEQAQMGKMDMGGMRMEEGQGMKAKASEAKQEQQVNGLAFVLSTEPAPPRIGENRIQLQVKGPSRDELRQLRVELTYTMPMPGMVPATIEMHSVEPGVFEASPNLGMAGQWDLTLVLHRPDRPAAETTFSIQVGGGMPGR